MVSHICLTDTDYFLPDSYQTIVLASGLLKLSQLDQVKSLPAV